MLLIMEAETRQVRGKRLAFEDRKQACHFTTMKENNEDQTIATSLPETVVVTNVDTLKSAFKQWAMEEAEQRQSADKELMLSEQAVLQMLGKSRYTLWRWDKSGYLPCYKKGGRNEYRLSDVERVQKCLGSQ